MASIWRAGFLPGTEPPIMPEIPRLMLEMRDVAKRFGANEVLRGVSLTVARGQTVVVIGPSGSGKTTLLRCVNLLEDYQDGIVTVDGEPVGYMLDRNGQRQRMAEREIAAQGNRVKLLLGNQGCQEVVVPCG